ncbi:MAG: FAD-dependent thymidylate synthase [Clostridia bacterium]|nr:FAD-dependent thymidylate synthase [Clostridia bacterium]
MPRVKPHVTLIRHTLSPEELVALSARLCYSRATVDDLSQRVAAADQSAFVERIMGMGHESVLEHASFTFAMEGVSRVLLAQLTRHRLASFSVQSQRYVSYAGGFNYILPPQIEALGEEAVAEYDRQMAEMHRWYIGWQEKLQKGEGGNEDARFVLPGACETRLIVTMNVRELRHFFSLRMCARAQWEIRAVATQMHRMCLEIAPMLFADAGPGCLRGRCPEGEKSCGRAAEIRRERQELMENLSTAATVPLPFQGR